MSVLLNSESGILLDHCKYTSKVYKNVAVNEEMLSFHHVLGVFCIKCSKRKGKERKRKSNSENFIKETAMVKNMFYKFVHGIPCHVKLDIFNRYNVMETPEVRNIAAKLFETTTFDLIGINGGNNSDFPLKCKIKDDFFLIPPKSRFYCGPIKELCMKLTYKKYDIVIADPPWWNKYIRRLKNANEKLSYSMMYNEDIADIPVKDLLSENSIIAVWCTNAPSNISAVKDVIFPKWGVEYVSTWYWLKLTIDMEPLCEFGTGCEKQPYERVLIGKVGSIKDVPYNQLFASVPSALHSHKPPLLDLLAPYVRRDNPQTLELFARYLLPNTTSIGYEPLKWQHLSLYELT